MRNRLAIIGSLCLTVLALGFPCWSARGANIFTFAPTAENGLRILDGSGPFFVAELGGDVHLESNMEDRTIMDFNLSGIPQGSVVSSATLTFPIQNQNTDLVRMINLSTFYGESSIQVADWNNGSFYMSFGDDYGIHNLDVTSAVQSALGSNQNLLDFRMTAGQYLVRSFIDPNGGSPNTRLTVVLVPEPGISALLGCSAGFGILLLRPRPKKSAKNSSASNH
jgi:hypothetical protein